MTRKSQQVADAARGATQGQIIIQQLSTHYLCLEIEGTADLIQSAYNQKAAEQMLRKHMGISVVRETKVPRDCVEAGKIVNMAGRICVPPQGVKATMITASAQIKTFKKTQLRTALFIEGQSVPITFKEMIPRMDMTRNSGMGRTPDVRFRPSFRDWKARVIVQFAETLSPATVVDLLNRGGAVGLCEWRPEKNGTFGTFRVSRHITDMKEISDVREECSVALVPLKIPEWAMDMEIDTGVLGKIFGEQGAEGGSSEDEQPAGNGAATE